MAIIDFIEKLQKKPRHIRIQIMWAGVAVGTVIVFVFWLWSLSVSLSQPFKASEDDKAWQDLSNLKKDIPDLWQSLGAGMSNVINFAKEGLKSSQEATSAPSSSLEELMEKLPIE